MTLVYVLSFIPPLSAVVRSGLGSAARCFLGHAVLLDYAGTEEKTAGETAHWGAGAPQHFTSEHQAHSAGPEGPDEPSQQSGMHSLLTEINPRGVPFSAHAEC